jgi:Fe-coproporphyrin III synthase
VQDSAVNGCFPDPYFESSDEENHLLSWDEAGQLRQAVKEIWGSRKAYPFFLNLDDILLIPQKGLQQGLFPKGPCLRTCIEPTVTPNGDILPCPFFSHYSLGNLHREKLENIWGNQAHRAFVRDQRDGKIKICNHCNMLLFKKGIGLTIKNTLLRWRYSLIG